METLLIKQTPQSFKITCEKGQIEIKGCSIINDPKVFFKPLNSWIRIYLKEPSHQTTINLKIEYIDSASLRVFLEVLQSLEKLIDEGKTITLNWYYDPKDPEIFKLGEILSGRLKIPFTFIQNDGLS